MGKLRFIFLIVFSLSFISAGFFGETWGKLTGNVVTGEIVNDCSDSDGGRNYFVQGRTGGVNINWITQNKIDYCQDTSNLIEYFCDTFHNNIVSGEMKKCEFKCENGACVQEYVALFSGGTKIYVNDSLNKIKNVLTKSNLPTLLDNGSFSGNVNAEYVQTIFIGSYPKITFERQPTSDNEPIYALKTSSTQANYIYNATITFSKAINFSHLDSKGKIITFFNKNYTISPSTDFNTLVLINGDEKLILEDGSAVIKGLNNEVIDGTLVDFQSYPIADLTDGLVKLTISVYAPESDKDAILAGQSFIDPVFGTFGLNFSDLNRNVAQEFKIYNYGDDKMILQMTQFGSGGAGFFAEMKNNSFQLTSSSISNHPNVYKTLNYTHDIGAEVLFYQPRIINLTWWDGVRNLSKRLRFPNYYGYDEIITYEFFDNTTNFWRFNFSDNSYFINTSMPAGKSSFILNFGKLYYNFTSTNRPDIIKIYLQDVNNVNIEKPAVVLLEGKDDNGDYNAIIVKLEGKGTLWNGVGVEAVQDTWSKMSPSWKATSPSNSKIEMRGDLWGSIISLNSTDSDQKTATISYPEEQIYPLIYISKI